MFARTPRLLLRPGWIDDTAALAAALNEQSLSRTLARVPFPYTEEDARGFLAQPADLRHPHLLAFSRTRGQPRLVGGCGIDPAGDGTVELGYWIARPYWGLGFATEAAGALVQAGCCASSASAPPATSSASTAGRAARMCWRRCSRMAAKATCARISQGSFTPTRRRSRLEAGRGAPPHR